MAFPARFTRVLMTSLVVLGGFALVSRLAGGSSSATRLDSAFSGLPVAAAASTEPWTKPVPRAECGKGDRIETGLSAQHSNILPLPGQPPVTPGELAAITSYNGFLAYR